ncbi:MAG TPA: ABC transporter permease [Gemmatimonadales bacterium]|nr:ABC transporter permease [Gemmatimonadales bacterium]
MTQKLRPLGATVSGTVRTYWRTALLLVLAAGTGLAMLLTITSFVGLDGWSGAGRMQPAPAFGVMTGLPFSVDMLSIAATRQAAVTQLFVSLLMGAGSAFAVIGLTILTVSAAREREREVEIAVRRAVGASRRLLLVAVLIEAVALILLVAGFGGPAGALLSSSAARHWPGLLSPGDITPSFQALLAIAGGIVFGAAVPVLFARRRRVVEGVARPLPLAIPATQLGLSLVVLTSGTLVARHALARAGSVVSPDPGALVYQLASAESGPADRGAEYARLLDRLEVSGAAASLSASGVLMGLGPVDVVTSDCGDCREGNLRLKFHEFYTTHLIVSPDTFKALNVKLIEGRLLTNADRMGSEKVVVINRNVALKHFQYGKPLGRQLKVGDDPDQWYTVVGVVDDPARQGLGASLQPQFTVYLSVLQQPARTVELMTAPANQATVASAMAATLGAAAAAVHPIRVSDLLRAEIAPISWVADRFAILGWGMFALAAGALFELMRLWVDSLKSELGIRMAVGASRRRMVLLVLGRTCVVGLAGIGVGFWFGPALWNGLRELLPGAPAWDAGVQLRYALLLMGAALAGAATPAWRAIGKPPAELVASEGS